MNSDFLELKNLVDGFKLTCQIEGKSPKTIEWYTAFLTRFRLFLESEQLPTALTVYSLLYVVYLRVPRPSVAREHVRGA